MIYEFFNHIAEFTKEFFNKEETWILLLLMIFVIGSVFMIPGVSPAGGVLEPIKKFLDFIWPIVLFFFALFITRSLWLFWRQELYKKSILKFVLLELKIPYKVERDPKAMEQVLAAIHSLRNVAGDINEKYWEGEITAWYSLELVSFGGEVHFYIRTKKTQQHLVESAFYSYYPDIEIEEVEDYTKLMPQTLQETYEKGYDIWGTEMILAREEVYPIRSYKDFKDPGKDERTVDPISTFLEILAKVKKSEIVGIQINIAPAEKEWADRWEKFVGDLKKPTFLIGVSDDGEKDKRTIPRTRGEEEVLEAVENNLSKNAFRTLVRFIYLSPRDIFYEGFPRRGLTGAFNQYSALNLNSFRQNYAMSTRTRFWNWPHVLPSKRNEYRKQRIIYNYIKREVPPETFMGKLMTSKLFNWNFSSRRFMMNTEGIATLFHIPTEGVLTTPHVDVIRSKKTGPPSGLEIFGEEDDENIEEKLSKKFESEEN